MSLGTVPTSLIGRRVLVPGGTGSVGEGIVRRLLQAGADVVVPTRSAERAAEFRAVLGDDATDRLHLVVHDYTTFDGATALVARTERHLGGVDDVVAPIGGFWGGKKLWEIDEADWQGAVVGLATTHMAVLRAALPRLSGRGGYTVVVGGSAVVPVPGSTLVSIEQAAVLMMQRCANAESDAAQHVHALVLGPIRSRATPGADPAWVSADEIGDVVVAVSAAALADGREFLVRDRSEFDAALTALSGRRG